MKLEEKLLEQYFDVIGKNGNTENQIQEFLEENTIIHTNCLFAKSLFAYELCDFQI